MPRSEYRRPLAICVLAVFVAISTARTAHAQLCGVGETHRAVVPGNVSSKFGSGVATDGNWAVVVGQNGTFNHPRAFVYHFDGASWILHSQLLPAGLTSSLSVSFAAVLQGDFLAFSHPVQNVPMGGAGAVYLYKLDGDQWLPHSTLISPTPSQGGRFGESLNMNGDLLIVGAPIEDNDILDSGSAYAYRLVSGSWQLEQELLPNDPQFNQRFGASVGVEGDTIVVGRAFPVASDGEAYVFHYDGAAWTQTQKLTPPEPTGFDRFGTAVAISEGQIVVGAPYHKVDGVANSGAAFVFNPGKTQYEFQQELTMPNDAWDTSATNQANYFGSAISMSDDLLLVQAPNDVVCLDDGPTYSSCDFDLGSALLYRFDGSSWSIDHRMRPKLLSYFISTPLPPGNIPNAMALSSTHAMLGVPTAKYEGLPGQNGIATFFDVVPPDCDGNGVPDSCEPDCNFNFISDVCDLAATSLDCDTDSIPDECGVVLAYAPNGGSVMSGWGNGALGDPGAFDFLWLNRFTVLPGHEYISHIAIAWGTSIYNHMPVKLIVYEDPTNDGNPSDAIMIASIDAVALNDYDVLPPPKSIPYSIYPITTLYVGNVGEHFFIAAYGTLQEADFPAMAWSNSGGGQSWTLIGAPGELALDKLDSNPSAPQPSSPNWMLSAITLDCNGNGVCDPTDISSGASSDVNTNGVPDDCEGSCIADLAPAKGGNGVVDVDDLLVVINSWGQCEAKQSCPADIAPPNAPNGVVDVDDLLELINNWGECV